MRLLLQVFLAMLISIPLALAVGGGSATLDEDFDQRISAELNTVKKTQGLLQDKLQVRRGEMKTRLRALYKLSRTTWPRLWLEPEARGEGARWLGAARRIAMRDIQELEQLRAEMSHAREAEARILAAREAGVSAALEETSFLSPVVDAKIRRPFGAFEGPEGARLRRRGIELRVRAGQRVRAVGPGYVRYVGHIAGIGVSVIIEHETHLSIVGGLARPQVAPGDLVVKGERLGQTRGRGVYVELRRKAGKLGVAIDPEPLLQD